MPASSELAIGSRSSATASTRRRGRAGWAWSTARPISCSTTPPPPRGLARNAAFRSRFEREWRLLAALEHPNVIPIYEAGEVEERPYLSMRWVSGRGHSASRCMEGGRPGRPKAVTLLDATRSLALLLKRCRAPPRTRLDSPVLLFRARLYRLAGAPSAFPPPRRLGQIDRRSPGSHRLWRFASCHERTADSARPVHSARARARRVVPGLLLRLPRAGPVDKRATHCASCERELRRPTEAA